MTATHVAATAVASRLYRPRHQLQTEQSGFVQRYPAVVSRRAIAIGAALLTGLRAGGRFFFPSY